MMQVPVPQQRSMSCMAISRKVGEDCAEMTAESHQIRVVWQHLSLAAILPCLNIAHRPEDIEST
jgi:hypothetical protein